MSRLLNSQEFAILLYKAGKGNWTQSKLLKETAQAQKDLSDREWVEWLLERAMWSDDGEQAVIVISKKDWVKEVRGE